MSLPRVRSSLKAPGVKAWGGLMRGLWLVILLWPFIAQARTTHLPNLWMTLAYALVALVAVPIFLTASTRAQLLGLGFMGSAALLSLTVLGVGGAVPARALVAYVATGLVALGSLGAEHRPSGTRLTGTVLVGALLFGPMALTGASSLWLGARLPWTMTVAGQSSLPATSNDPAKAREALARIDVGRAPATANGTVMTITGAPAPAYWTMAVYDDFDGRAWTAPADGGPSQPGAIGGGASLLPTEVSGFGTQAWTVTVDRLDRNSPLVYAGTPEAVMGPAGSAGSTASSNLRVDPELRALWAPGVTSYTLRLSVPEIDSDALRAAGYASPAADLKRDLTVPSGISPKVGDLARSIAGKASGPWAAAESVADYLTAHETYTTRFSGSAGDTVNSFLLDTHSGSCDQFSTSFVVMMRELGVPARWVMGYRVGDDDLQTMRYVVKAGDAHSWAEVYVAPYGWIPVDPTPGGQATGSTVVGGPGSLPVQQPPVPTGDGTSPNGAGTEPGETAGGPTQGQKTAPVSTALVVLTLILLIVGVLAAVATRRRRSAQRRVDRLWRGLASLAAQRGHRPPHGRLSPAASTTPREVLGLVPEGSRQALIPVVRLLERAWYGEERLPGAEVDRAEALLRAEVSRALHAPQR